MSLVLLRPVALASAAAIAAIVLLHVIQSRWRRRVVPSLIIWRRVLARGVAVRAKRPSVDLPLVLALAAAAFLVLATAGPKLVSVGGGPDELVIVIDNGTSSLTEDLPGPTRFAESVRRTRRRLAALAPGGRAALVVTSPEPRVVVGFADAPPDVARALEGVAPVQITGSLESAVALALAQGTGAGRVVVFTSRSLPGAPPRVRVERVGSPSRNVAITHADFSAEEAFCAIRNYSARDAATRVRLRDASPATPRDLLRREVAVPAGGRAEVVFAPEGEALDRYTEARAVSLTVEHAVDDLAADDIAWAGPRFGRARRVGVVGEPSEPVARALRAAGAETVALAGTGAPAANVDLVVYVSRIPDSWPPARPAVLVAPERSAGPVRLLGEELRDVKARLLVGAGAVEIVRDFPPVGLRIRRAARVRIMARCEPLVVSEDGGEVLGALIREGARRHVYLGFRPEDSDWPERASFPVFICRILDSVASGGAERGTFCFARVGDSAAAHLPPDARTVVLPGGADLPAEARLLAGGLYRVRWAGRGEEQRRGLLAVNLLSETESDNRLASPEEGPKETSAEEASPAAAAEALPARRVRARDLAGALAAAALVLVAAEWVASARRA